MRKMVYFSFRFQWNNRTAGAAINSSAGMN